MSTNHYDRIIQFLIALFSVTASGVSALAADNVTIKLNQGEKIWSGAIKEGHLMPWSDNYKYDFYANNNWNQIQPLIISNQGLYVWSEEPFKFELRNGELIITDPYNSVKTGRQGTTLAEVQHYVSKTYFPVSGKSPDHLLFSRPQYNTWIELTYNQNQKDVLKYAIVIVENNLPTGVILVPHMILEGLSGYTFSCPDMIGGGDWTSFLNRSTFDQDLVVMSANAMHYCQ